MNTGMPSPELRDQLRKVFGVKKLKPENVKKPAPLPIHDELKDKTRSVNNVMLAAAAQGIYGGGPTPPPTAPTPVKPATKAQAGQGTAPAMSQQGPWGTPEKE